MSPDSPLGRLQERVARLEQRVDDLTSRAIERFEQLTTLVREGRSENAQDFERFLPMLQDQSAIRGDMRHLTADVEKVVRGMDVLEQRLEEEKRERIAGQQARKEELEAAIAERNLEIRQMEEREKEREIARQQHHAEQRKSNLQLLAGMVSIFLTSLGGIAVAWISQRGGMK